METKERTDIVGMEMTERTGYQGEQTLNGYEVIEPELLTEDEVVLVFSDPGEDSSGVQFIRVTGFKDKLADAKTEATYLPMDHREAKAKSHKSYRLGYGLEMMPDNNKIYFINNLFSRGINADFKYTIWAPIAYNRKTGYTILLLYTTKKTQLIEIKVSHWAYLLTEDLARYDRGNVQEKVVDAVVGELIRKDKTNDWYSNTLCFEIGRPFLLKGHLGEFEKLPDRDSLEGTYDNALLFDNEDDQNLLNALMRLKELEPLTVSSQGNGQVSCEYYSAFTSSYFKLSPTGILNLDLTKQPVVINGVEDTVTWVFGLKESYQRMLSEGHSLRQAWLQHNYKHPSLSQTKTVYFTDVKTVCNMLQEIPDLINMISPYLEGLINFMSKGGAKSLIYRTSTMLCVSCEDFCENVVELDGCVAKHKSDPYTTLLIGLVDSIGLNELLNNLLSGWVKIVYVMIHPSVEGGNKLFYGYSFYGVAYNYQSDIAEYYWHDKVVIDALTTDEFRRQIKYTLQRVREKLQEYEELHV